MQELRQCDVACCPAAFHPCWGLRKHCHPSLLSFAFGFFFCTISLSLKKKICSLTFFFFFALFFLSDLLKYFICVHLFVLAAPGPCCYGGCPPGVVCGLLTVGASLVSGHGLQGVQTSAVVAPQF